MKINRFLTVILACFLFSLSGWAQDGFSSSARWICYPEPVAEGRNNERYYRTEFEVDGPIREATVHMWIDDKGSLCINGVPVTSRPRVETDRFAGYNVTSIIPQGQVCFAANVTNMGGLGGLLCHLEIVYEDGRVQDVFSTADWRSSKEAAEGWKMPGFDDSAWVRSQDQGDISTQIWAGMYDLTPMLSKAELAERAKIRQNRRAKGLALREQLAKEPPLRAGIRYKEGRGYFTLNDKDVEPILYHAANCYSVDNPIFRQQIRDFAEGGTHLYGISFLLKYLWNSDDSVTTALIQETLEDFLELDPNAYFTIGFNFEIHPAWWVEANPDECISYEKGPSDPKEGNVFKLFRAPSYASLKWRREIGNAIGRLVAALEKTELSRRIFSYRIDCGIYTEWHYYGMHNMPDNSRPMTEAFRQWLIRHYPDDASLQKAWGKEDVTRETAITPPQEQRASYGIGQLRDDIHDRWTLDYLACMREVIRDCTFDLCRVPKEQTGNRVLVGQYAGYFFGMNFPAEGWHLANDEVLDSPYVDFQIAPFCYGKPHREIGGYGQLRPLTSTYPLRNKLCILEADTRTHLEPNHGLTFCENDAESIGLLARDMAHALANGCGVWYYDFGKLWYTSDGLRKFLHELNAFRNLEGDLRSAAEVAVVFDYDNVPYFAVEQVPTMPQWQISQELPMQLGKCGTMFDVLSFEDLSNPLVRDYKVYIFPALYHVTQEQAAVLEGLKKNGKSILWGYAPGFLTPEKGHDIASVEQLTGIRVALAEGQGSPDVTMEDWGTLKPVRSQLYGPVLYGDDPYAEVWGTIRCKGVNYPAVLKLAQDGWTSYLCTSPFLPYQVIQRVLDDAGVHRYCTDENAVVLANASTVVLHAGDNAPKTLRFPRPVHWQQFFPAQVDYPDVSDTLTFQPERGSTYFFRCLPAKP